MKHILLPAAVASLMTISCSTARQAAVKVSVTPTSSMSNATENVVVYHLPQTVLRVEVEMDKVIRKAGPYFRYTERLLNISNVILEDSESWRIRSIKVVPVGRADDNQAYAIAMDGPGVAQNVTLNNQGVLCGINLSTPCMDVPAASYVYTPEIQKTDVTFDAVPRLEKLLKQTSTAAMAEEAANYIYKIRKRRSKIFSANFPILPPDGLSLELTKAELDTLETQFMELFTGKETVQTIKRVIEHIPTRTNPENTVLFRFSTNAGMVDPMDLSGAPVYLEVKHKAIPELPHAEAKKETKSNGLYHIKPGKATVRIVDRSTLMLEEEMDIAQFGQVMSMPAAVLEQPNVSIELSPVTGALKRVSTGK